MHCSNLAADAQIILEYNRRLRQHLCSSGVYRGMQLVDLSHKIETGMPLFSNRFPNPTIRPWMSHDESAESGLYENCTCEISEVQFVTSIGTYLDSPYHFHPTLKSIDQLELEQLILPGVTIDCGKLKAREEINPEVLDEIDMTNKAVIFRTYWSRYWGESIYRDTPFLTEDTALALVRGHAKLVGVDFLAVDNPADPRRPVHVTLLKNDILIVENLTQLEKLPISNYMFHAVPVKVAGAAAFPIRAYAITDD